MFLKDFEIIIPYDQKVCVCVVNKEYECVDSYVGDFLKIPYRFMKLEISFIRTLKPDFLSVCVVPEE